MITKVVAKLRVTQGKNGRGQCSHPNIEIYEDAHALSDEYRVVCLICGREWTK